MTCIMKNGCLQYDFVRDLSSHMRNLSSHHRIAENVADDHQVYVLQLKEPNVSKARVVNTKQNITKHKAPAHIDPLEDYKHHMLLPLLSVMTKKV